jgi:hypothetical protein
MFGPAAKSSANRRTANWPVVGPTSTLVVRLPGAMATFTMSNMELSITAPKRVVPVLATAVSSLTEVSCRPEVSTTFAGGESGVILASPMGRATGAGGGAGAGAGSDVPGVEVPGVEVPGADVPGSDVPGSGVRGADVPGSDVPGVEVPGADVPGSDVPGSGVRGADVPGSDVPGVEVPGVEVPGADVPGADVPGSGVRGADVPGSDVPGVEVPGVEVPGADVPGADVPGADVPGADVPGSDVRGADVPGADVMGSDVPGSDVPGAAVGGEELPPIPLPKLPVVGNPAITSWRTKGDGRSVRDEKPPDRPGGMPDAILSAPRSPVLPPVRDALPATEEFPPTTKGVKGRTVADATCTEPGAAIMSFPMPEPIRVSVTMPTSVPMPASLPVAIAWSCSIFAAVWASIRSAASAMGAGSAPDSASVTRNQSG